MRVGPRPRAARARPGRSSGRCRGVRPRRPSPAGGGRHRVAPIDHGATASGRIASGRSCFGASAGDGLPPRDPSLAGAAASARPPPCAPWRRRPPRSAGAPDGRDPGGVGPQRGRGARPGPCGHLPGHGRTQRSHRRDGGNERRVGVRGGHRSRLDPRRGGRCRRPVAHRLRIAGGRHAADHRAGVGQAHQPTHSPDAFGDDDLRLEDLWIPTLLVSANLTTADTHNHLRGLAWRAVRASVAIPGVFPPMSEPEGLLVDGGLVDNLPVARLRAQHPEAFMITSDAGRRVEFPPDGFPADGEISGWSAWRLRRRSSRSTHSRRRRAARSAHSLGWGRQSGGPRRDPHRPSAPRRQHVRLRQGALDHAGRLPAGLGDAGSPRPDCGPAGGYDDVSSSETSHGTWCTLWVPSIPFSSTWRESPNSMSPRAATISRTRLDTRISPPSARLATRAAMMT